MSYKLHFVPKPVPLEKISFEASSNGSRFSYCGKYPCLTPLWDGFGLSHCFFDTLSSVLFVGFLILVVCQIIKIKK